MIEHGQILGWNVTDNHGQNLISNLPVAVSLIMPSWSTTSLDSYYTRVSLRSRVFLCNNANIAYVTF